MTKKRIAELRALNEKQIGIGHQTFSEALDAIEALNIEVYALQSQIKVRDKVFASECSGYNEQILELETKHAELLSYLPKVPSQPYEKELAKELADYKEQLRWSLKNEERYKQSLSEQFAEVKRLRTALEAVANVVDEELLLDEKLAEGWDALRGGVLLARKALQGDSNE